MFLPAYGTTGERNALKQKQRKKQRKYCDGSGRRGAVKEKPEETNRDHRESFSVSGFGIYDKSAKADFQKGAENAFMYGYLCALEDAEENTKKRCPCQRYQHRQGRTNPITN